MDAETYGGSNETGLVTRRWITCVAIFIIGHAMTTRSYSEPPITPASDSSTPQPTPQAKSFKVRQTYLYGLPKRRP